MSELRVGAARAFVVTANDQGEQIITYQDDDCGLDIIVTDRRAKVILEAINIVTQYENISDSLEEVLNDNN